MEAVSETTGTTVLHCVPDRFPGIKLQNPACLFTDFLFLFLSVLRLDCSRSTKSNSVHTFWYNCFRRRMAIVQSNACHLDVDH
jgi:hypothetical protein